MRFVVVLLAICLGCQQEPLRWKKERLKREIEAKQTELAEVQDQLGETE